ncbi:MAG: hypothetical protein KDD02_01430 [Phaeodactylibacter sp.]|nr:hypothetical protein [Phaeodactylibacter sp.]MCB9304432.1 hypothetical protein [Lewinellaceae bacterium]
MNTTKVFSGRNLDNKKLRYSVQMEQNILGTRQKRRCGEGLGGDPMDSIDPIDTLDTLDAVDTLDATLYPQHQ